MNYLTQLKKIAKNRERSYRIANMMQEGKMKAISKIIREADFFSGKGEAVQLRTVAKVEREIHLILPDPRSRYSKLRENMLDLLEKAKNE